MVYTPFCVGPFKGAFKNQKLLCKNPIAFNVQKVCYDLMKSHKV